jgi:hypothetical protein
MGRKLLLYNKLHTIQSNYKFFAPYCVEAGGVWKRNILEQSLMLTPQVSASNEVMPHSFEREISRKESSLR